MKYMKWFYKIKGIMAILFIIFSYYACSKDDSPVITPITHPSFYDEGLDLLFNINAIPEFCLEVNESEWNELLKKYDQDKNIKDYIHSNISFINNAEILNISEVGLRLHGNTSRRRPEGKAGESHSSTSQWHHCHYMINLDKYKKDNSNTLKGVNKVIFKWFHNDPSYVREIYCYDLFKRYGIWTIAFASYCKLSISIKDECPVYLGVYGMFEAIDGDYLKRRKSLFLNDNGFLWKCANVGLNDISDNLFFIDDNSTVEHPYELKEGKKHFEDAKLQLKSFITTFHEKQGEEFVEWIEKVCDIKLLLRTYAVNVAVGNWDDYWNHATNYYVYFNSRDVDDYQFFFIPYDLDEVLGRTAANSYQKDAVLANPLDWGNPRNDLISKIISFPKYRKIYVDALKELANPEYDLFYTNRSIKRICKWHLMIHNYVVNDTGEDMVIEDIPGSWSSASDYRLWEVGESNFFDIKCRIINSLPY